MTRRTAVVILIIGWFVLCKPWFFDHKVVPWDSKDQFYPFAHFVTQSIRSGESPFWNPYVYAGYPMASDPQSLMFSPIALGLALIPSRLSMQWFDTIALLHLLIGGVGMLLLSMRFGRSPVAGLFAAAVFMFGGSAAARMQHVPMIYAYAYFPFALLALEQMLDSDSLLWAACFGVLAGVIAGHMNQVAFLLSIVLIGYCCFRAVSSGSLRKFALLHWRPAVLALVIGMTILAGPLFLVLQFLPFSNRPEIPYEMAAANSMNPLAFLTLLIRNFFGNARPNSAWGPWDPTESLFYAGTLPIVLILRYGVAGGALLDRRFRYFTGVGILAILYMVGHWTPFYWLAYQVVPGVSFYRRPNDASFILNIVLALGTGFLVDQLRAGPGKIRRSVTWIAGTAGAGFLMWAAYVAWRENQLFTSTMARDLALAAVFIGGALWLWRAIAGARSETKRMTLMSAALLLLAADLGVHTAGSRLNAVPETDFALLIDGASQRDPVAKVLEEGLAAAGGPYRADITMAGAAWANAPMLLGIQSTQGYNPLRYALVDRVAGTAESFGVTRPFSRLVPGYNSPLLNLLGVRYIVSVKRLREIDPGVDESRFRLVSEGEVGVWENPNALPRVVAFTEIYIEPDVDRAIDQGSVAPVDFRSTAVLPHLPATLSVANLQARTRTILPGEGDARARLLEYRNTEVIIEIDSPRDAIVELHDPYYFAWHAYVDGAEREILQSNYMFRGVHVKPGERRIVFRFEPFSWTAIHQTIANR